VFFHSVLPKIDRMVRGSEPIDKQIEMCLDRLEVISENRTGYLVDVMKVESQLGDAAAILLTMNRVYL
jgi:2-iminobutanoate/2-iminopropanoate deaminase